MLVLRLSERSFNNLVLRTLSSQAPYSTIQPKSFDEIPGPKGIYGLPILGAALLFQPFTNYTAETYHKLMDNMFDKYGPIFKFRLNFLHVVTSDPKDFETVLRHEGKYPERSPASLLKVLSKRLGLKDSLINMQGKEWHTLRSPLNRYLMKTDSALHYIWQQNEIAEEFAHMLAVKIMSPEELAELFFRFSAESIGLVTFNKRLGFFKTNLDEEANEFLQATRDEIKLFYYCMSGKSIAHVWYRNKTYREYEKVTLIAKRMALKQLAMAREENKRRKKEGTLNPDEPNLLLSLTNEKALSNEDITNIMTTMYNVGTDSTAKNLQALFFNLAKNPDKQEAVRNEIISLIGEDGPVTSSALAQMTYLKACLKESFRLNYPLPIGTDRRLPTDVILSNYVVPAGTPILMANSRASKTLVADPDKYIPERWLRTGESIKQDSASNYISLPFGHGPRNCIGRRFAEQEIYLATSKVLQKLKIEVEPESLNSDFIYKLFIEPEKPLRFKFTRK